MELANANDKYVRAGSESEIKPDGSGHAVSAFRQLFGSTSLVAEIFSTTLVRVLAMAAFAGIALLALVGTMLGLTVIVYSV